MTELQPCPICKGTRICMDGGDNTYHPRCLDCGCTAPFDAWQSRTPSPAEVERLVDGNSAIERLHFIDVTISIRKIAKTTILQDCGNEILKECGLSLKDVKPHRFAGGNWTSPRYRQVKDLDRDIWSCKIGKDGITHYGKTMDDAVKKALASRTE